MILHYHDDAIEELSGLYAKSEPESNNIVEELIFKTHLYCSHPSSVPHHVSV